MLHKATTLLLGTLSLVACDSGCKPEGYLYQSSLELLNTHCKSMIGREVSVIGYLYDATPVPENPSYLLLPGSDYAELSDGNRLASSFMLFFKDNEEVVLPEACIGRMVEVTGTVGVFSGVGAIKDVEMIVSGPGAEICHPNEA